MLVIDKDGLQLVVTVHDEVAGVEGIAVTPAQERVVLRGCGMDADGAVLIILMNAKVGDRSHGRIRIGHVKAVLDRSTRHKDWRDELLTRLLSSTGIDVEITQEHLGLGLVESAELGGVGRHEVDGLGHGVKRVTERAATAHAR